MSVEELFIENEQSSKFDLYLSSLNNLFQLIGHAEFNLPFNFKRFTGKRAERNPREFDTFKFRTLGFEFDKLNAERNQKLKTELGDAFFLKMDEFHKAQQNLHPSPRFPL